MTKEEIEKEITDKIKEAINCYIGTPITKVNIDRLNMDLKRAAHEAWKDIPQFYIDMYELEFPDIQASINSLPERSLTIFGLEDYLGKR